MRNYVKNLLMGEYEIIPVSNGQEAMSAIKNQIPDLVLSDIMMPVMNGIQLVKAIRSDSSLIFLPVILLSARTSENSKLSGIETGADDYISKPFSAKELKARVQTMLNNSGVKKDLISEVQRANEELRAFSYSASHDLRTPLRAIDGFCTAFLSEYQEKLDSQGKHYLSRIRNGVQRMGQLIDDLLRLSHISQASLTLREFDLAEVARNILGELGHRDPERMVEIQLPNQLLVTADSPLMVIALTNLLENAWKFTSKKMPAIIEIGQEVRDNRKVCFVRDNGAGFEMAYVDKLFKPFQRLHHHSEFEGTGIGLAIVHRIVSRHGGQVWAESDLSRGTTVFFTLEKVRG